MVTRLTACLILLSGLCATARADETALSSAHRAVLDAQYAARQQPLPARPEEAQRIYENYLRSIGRPTRNLSTNPRANSPTPSR
jgi:hypothetical protein